MKAAIEKDAALAELIELQTTVDDVENMKGKGQYLYAHVATSKDALPADSEPIFKFNDGHYGGSHEVLNEECRALADGNVFAGSCLAALKPAVMKLLDGEPSEDSKDEKLVVDAKEETKTPDDAK